MTTTTTHYSFVKILSGIFVRLCHSSDEIIHPVLSIIHSRQVTTTMTRGVFALAKLNAIVRQMNAGAC